jgi:hypothetical protein
MLGMHVVVTFMGDESFHYSHFYTKISMFGEREGGTARVCASNLAWALDVEGVPCP